MTAPSVSVLMASYNGAALIGDTVRSLQAQTCQDWELLVVDDCSSDETPQVLASFTDPRIRIFSTPVNSGPVGARNLAVQHARGSFFAALDQDDICLPHRLERQLAVMRADPSLVLLGTDCYRLTAGALSRDTLPRRTTPLLMRYLLRILNPFVWSTVMMRADAVRSLPVFQRKELQYAEDYDLYHRLAPLGGIARLDEVLLHYRCHPQGASQRLEQRMSASAMRCLADQLRPQQGADADEQAALLVRHVSRRLPVANLAALQQVMAAIERAWAPLRAARPPDPATESLLTSELARLRRDLTGRLVRSTLRRGLAPSAAATRRSHPS